MGAVIGDLLAAAADILDMDEYPGIEPGASAYDAAIEHVVRAIRKAQGKKNPEDCAMRSHEWAAVAEDFLNDVARAAGAGPDFTATTSN